MAASFDSEPMGDFRCGAREGDWEQKLRGREGVKQRGRKSGKRAIEGLNPFEAEPLGDFQEGREGGREGGSKGGREGGRVGGSLSLPLSGPAVSA